MDCSFLSYLCHLKKLRAFTALTPLVNFICGSLRSRPTKSIQKGGTFAHTEAHSIESRVKVKRVCTTTSSSAVQASLSAGLKLGSILEMCCGGFSPSVEASVGKEWSNSLEKHESYSSDVKEAHSVSDAQSMSLKDDEYYLEWIEVQIACYKIGDDPTVHHLHVPVGAVSKEGMTSLHRPGGIVVLPNKPGRRPTALLKLVRNGRQ